MDSKTDACCTLKMAAVHIKKTLGLIKDEIKNNLSLITDVYSVRISPKGWRGRHVRFKLLSLTNLKGF